MLVLLLPYHYRLLCELFHIWDEFYFQKLLSLIFFSHWSTQCLSKIKSDCGMCLGLLRTHNLHDKLCPVSSGSELKYEEL